MKKRDDKLFYVIEAIIWYFFISYFLFAIKSGYNLWIDSLVLLVLAYLGVLACPWTRRFEKHIGKGK